MRKTNVIGQTVATFFGLSLVLFLLAGCSLFGGESANATPTAPAGTTPLPTMPNLQMTTYQGDSFSISYPQSAKKQVVSKDIVIFTDAQTGIGFEVIALPDPEGVVSADTVAKATVDNFNQQYNFKNATPVNAAGTKTVGGVAWKQVVENAQASSNNESVPYQEVRLSVNHPDKSPQTKAFAIAYLAPQQLMSQVDPAVFEPMLQSFKFTA